MMDKKLSKPVPDGHVEILLFKSDIPINYYFSDIETWKTPCHTHDQTLRIIYPDRVVNYPLENIKCYTLYPNSKGFQHEIGQWIREQHDLGHPDEMPYQCQHCVESDETLAELRKRLAGDK